MKSPNSRRTFLKISSVVGGGLAFGLQLLPDTIQATANAQTNITFQPNRFLTFQKDGFILFHSSKTEMGQGTATNLKRIVAEELGVMPKQIIYVVQSPRKGFNVATGGSWGNAGFYRYGRPLFAQARQVLINAAAKKWSVSSMECFVDNGIIKHAKSDRKIAYHQLIELANELEIPKEVPIIEESNFKWIGKAAPLENLDKILNGSAQYGIDQYVEGMVYASLERCPVVGGKLKHYDDSEALNLKGVQKVIPLQGTTWDAYDYYPSSVAVIANNSWIAQEGRKVLKIEWEEGINQRLDNKYIHQVFSDKLQTEGNIFKKTGDIQQAIEKAEETMEATYESPFWSHSPMETMNTIAYYKNDGCEIWTPCHAQTRLLNAIKKITGFEDEQIKIHTPLLGGSFGRRLLVDYAIEAVLLSKALQKPVQALFSRIDETKFGHFMSGGMYQLKSTIKNKQLTSLSFRSVNLSPWSQREAKMLKNGIDHAIADDVLRYPYEIPNVQYEHHLANEVQIPVSWWRGTFANSNSFVIESWIDEIAARLKQDPLTLRLNLLKDDTAPYLVRAKPEESEWMDKKLAKEVLIKAAESADWHIEREKGRGKGIAWCFTFFESYAAIVADVRVSNTNRLSINKVTCALECGVVINPNMVKAQIEGGIIWALSAMKASITFEEGRVKESSFGDYPILTYGECPEIEVIILKSQRPTCGVGELANIPTFAAVCNAIYDACGLRIRKLPLQEVSH